MKTNRLLLACAALCGLATAPAFAQGTAFTYQGVLSQSGAAVNGSNDLTFTLYNAVSGGGPIGTSNVVADLRMTNGLFTVTLDFGAGAFNGSDRWLQIAARPGASTGAYTNLVPRQPITATPYAIYSGGASAAGLSGTIAGSQIAPGAIGSTHISNSVSLWNRSGNNISYNNGNVSIGTSVLHGSDPGLVEIESGVANTPALRLSSDGPGHGSGLWFENRNGGNAKTWAMYAGAAGGLHLGYQNTFSDVLYFGTNLNVGIGTTGPSAKLHVNGTLRATSFIGDGSGLTGLTATTNASQLTGGTLSDARLSANVALRGGGNTFSGNQIITSGNVGIGTATPAAELHVLGSGWFGADSGGLPSTAGAGVRVFYDTVTAAGLISAYNYATGQPANLGLQQSGGNVGIGTTTPTTKLDVAGEATMTACNITSDRHAKEDFKPVSTREVLEKVASLAITEWQYKAHPGVRHIGPVAQDFHAAFATGRDDKHITTVDADGVALAAIQGLNEKVEEKDARIRELEKSVAELKELVNRLTAPSQPAGR